MDSEQRAALQEQRLIEHRAQMARLKQVAATINRGPSDKYFGADFHIAFNFLYGEVEVLQKDPEFSMAHDRLMQILQASEAVLLDSISPVENNKRIAEMKANKQANKRKKDK